MGRYLIITIISFSSPTVPNTHLPSTLMFTHRATSKIPTTLTWHRTTTTINVFRYVHNVKCFNNGRGRFQSEWYTIKVLFIYFCLFYFLCQLFLTLYLLSFLYIVFPLRGVGVKCFVSHFLTTVFDWFSLSPKSHNKFQCFHWCFPSFLSRYSYFFYSSFHPFFSSPY